MSGDIYMEWWRDMGLNSIKLSKIIVATWESSFQRKIYTARLRIEPGTS